MGMQALPLNRTFALMFAMALAVAIVAALQSQARPFAPSIPVDPRIQQTTVETRATPVVPLVVPSASETAPVAPGSEASEQPSANTTVPPVPAGPPASKPLPAQPKVAPDGRPMGDFELPPLGNHAWKGAVDPADSFPQVMQVMRNGRLSQCVASAKMRP